MGKVPELKHCPFCGGEARFDIKRNRLGIEVKHNYYCINNGVTGYLYGYYKFNIMAEEYKGILEEHMEKLAERWNRREE